MTRAHWPHHNKTSSLPSLHCCLSLATLRPSPTQQAPAFACTHLPAHAAMLAEMLRRLRKKPPPLHRNALSLWIDTVGAEGVHVDEAKALHFMYGIPMKKLLKRTQPKAIKALVAMGKAASRGELGSDDGAYALPSPPYHARMSTSAASTSTTTAVAQAKPVGHGRPQHQSHCRSYPPLPLHAIASSLTHTRFTLHTVQRMQRSITRPSTTAKATTTA